MGSKKSCQAFCLHSDYKLSSQIHNSCAQVRYISTGIATKTSSDASTVSNNKVQEHVKCSNVSLFMKHFKLTVNFRNRDLCFPLLTFF